MLISISDGDRGFIAEFISTFEKSSLQQIDAMKLALADQNFAELKRLAHKVKPTISMLGMTCLDKVEQINLAPETANETIIHSIVDEANATLEALKKEFSV